MIERWPRQVVDGAEIAKKTGGRNDGARSGASDANLTAAAQPTVL